MGYVLNFREVTYALSEALDLVGIDDIRHGKRVAFMASECAKEGGSDQDFIDDLIFIGMLHDCGVSTTDMHKNLVTRLEWKDEQLHCIRGAGLLEKARMFKAYARPVYYHHTHWEALETLAVDERMKRQANLIYLVDRVDALRAQIEGQDLEKRETIERIIVEHSGTFFAPELVELFLAASKRNAFWFSLDNESLEESLLEWVAKGETTEVSFAELKEVAVMFADIVDAKSPFTVEHSFGVAALSVYLARRFGLDTGTVETVELAALLHDLGKLRVHDAVLNKHGALDEEERMMMNRHGFDSNMILRRIQGFGTVAYLASLHHETLDGKGYPYSMTAEQIPFSARIIAVADIFQALVQERPYRTAMSAAEAYRIVEAMASEGKLDRRVTDALGADLETAYRTAKSKEHGQDVSVPVSSRSVAR